MKLSVNGVTVDAVTFMGFAVYVKPVDEKNGLTHATNRANERAVNPALLSEALTVYGDEIRDIAAHVSKEKRQCVVFRWKTERQTIIVEVGRKGKMPTVGIVTFLDVFKEYVHKGDITFDL